MSSDIARTGSRIVSIDLLRGLVMVIMAIDHVRDYWSQAGFDPLDLTQTTPQLFLTRWITHFCAPTFVFLSGASAWLYRRYKNVGTGELSRFLLTRGLWLVLIEITIVSMSWQFGYQIFILQVIWAIGCSMIALAALVWLPWQAILGIGLVMIFGHNLLDGIAPERFGSMDWLWIILHVQHFIPLTIGGGICSAADVGNSLQALKFFDDCDKRIPYPIRYRPDALLNPAVFLDAMPASTIKPIMAAAFLSDPVVGAR